MQTNYEDIKNAANTLGQLAEWLFTHGGCRYCIYDLERECNPEVGCIGGIKRWLLRKAGE